MSDNNDVMLEVKKSVDDIRALAESKNAETAEIKAQIKRIGDEAASNLEKVQASELKAKEEANQLKSEMAKIKSDYEDLYKKANRIAAGKGDGESETDIMLKKYGSEMDLYLRKGVKPSDESLNEIAYFMAKQSMATQDEAKVKSAAQNFFDSNGDSSGYLSLNKKSMFTGANPDGGYFTTVDRRTDIKVGRIFETSPMRAIANIITTTSGDVELIIDDNQSTSGGWVGEVTAPSDTANAKIGVLRITTHEQYAQPKVTQKMLDDASINIEAWLSAKTNDILRRTENTAFVSGSGANSPKGFLSYSAWAAAGTYERDKIEQVNSGTSGAVTADGLIGLQGALIEDYQANAVFMLKRDTFTAVSKLKAANGEYLFNATMMADGVSRTILGKPFYFANDMQAVAADSLSIAYGDFGVGYTIVDRLGLRVLRDPFTDKPYIKFYTTKRVGGAVTNYEAIKIQKLAA